MQRSAGYRSSLCTALAAALKPLSLLVLRGDKNETEKWHDALRNHYLPDTLIIKLDKSATPLPAALDKPITEKMTAWLCIGTQCLPPIDELEKLLEVLASH